MHGEVVEVVWGGGCVRGCTGDCSRLGRGEGVDVEKVDIIEEGAIRVVGDSGGGVVGVGIGEGGDGGLSIS